MFILRKGLPTTVFYPRQTQTDLHSVSEEDWILLYSSSSDGLSINRSLPFNFYSNAPFIRFESKVFDYKGPTVAIFSLNSEEIYAIVCDEEWKLVKNLLILK